MEKMQESINKDLGELQRSMVGYSSWGWKESDTTEQLNLTQGELKNKHTEINNTIPEIKIL